MALSRHVPRRHLFPAKKLNMAIKRVNEHEPGQIIRFFERSPPERSICPILYKNRKLG